MNISSLTTKTTVKEFNAIAKMMGIQLIKGDARKPETKQVWIDQINEAIMLDKNTGIEQTADAPKPVAKATKVANSSKTDLLPSAYPSKFDVLKALKAYAELPEKPTASVTYLYKTLYNGVKNDKTTEHLGEILADMLYDDGYIEPQGHYKVTDKGLSYMSQIDPSISRPKVVKIEPSKDMLLVAIANFKHNRLYNQSLAEYLKTKFNNMSRVNDLLWEMIHHHSWLYFTLAGELELNNRGLGIFTEFMQSRNIVMLIVDGKYVGSMTMQEYKDGSSDKAREAVVHPWNSYKVYAGIVSSAGKIGILYSVASKSVDPSEVEQIALQSGDELIASTLAFWKEYDMLFSNDLVIY